MTDDILDNKIDRYIMHAIVSPEKNFVCYYLLTINFSNTDYSFEFQKNKNVILIVDLTITISNILHKLNDFVKMF